MPNEPLPTEVILSHSCQRLSQLTLAENPQPGSDLEIDGKTYRILERSHRYHLQGGRYCLSKVSLYVQPVVHAAEKTWMGGRWVIGDAACRYNARSEWVRCAVNPEGPCQDCRFYEVGLDEARLGNNA